MKRLVATNAEQVAIGAALEALRLLGLFGPSTILPSFRLSFAIPIFTLQLKDLADAVPLDLAKRDGSRFLAKNATGLAVIDLDADANVTRALSGPTAAGTVDAFARMNPADSNPLRILNIGGNRAEFIWEVATPPLLVPVFLVADASLEPLYRFLSR